MDTIGVPIYLDFVNYKNVDEDAFKSIIDSNIQKEYQDEYSTGIFYSENINRRIALIDNFVLNKDSKRLLDIITKYFGKIIITCDGTNYGSTELERIAVNSLLNDSLLIYELRPMFKQKRYELVEKRYRALLKSSDRSIDENDVKVLYQKVQMILDKYVGSDANYPYFINKVIVTVLNDNVSLSTDANRMYSRVYETFVGNAMLDIFQNQEEAIISQELLKIIANKIIRNDSYRITRRDFYGIISDFFEEKRIISFSSDEIISKLVEKKVLIIVSDNCYAFGSYDFLAYFAARYFSDQINEDFEAHKNEIDSFLELSYDDVISKFLLFVVSLASKKTALYLIDIAEKFVSKYEDFEVTQCEFALCDEEFKGVKRLTRKDRQNIRAKIDSKESENYDNEKRKYKESVDVKKDIISDDDYKKYCECIGLLDIISSMLPDLKVVLGASDQDRCIKILYKLPTIVFEYAVGPLSKHHKEFATELKIILGKMGKVITDESADKIIIEFCRSTFLAIADHTMRRAHTKLTENDLRKKDFSNSDTKRLIRLMSTMHDENAEETFEKYSKDYFDYFKSSPFARNCISLMVRNYVSWYLTEEKALTKKEYLRMFLKDDTVVASTIKANLKLKTDK